MSDAEFRERLKNWPSSIRDPYIDAIRKVYDLCDELGASFVRGVALEWRREDDERETPIDNGSLEGGPMTPSRGTEP